MLATWPANGLPGQDGRAICPDGRAIWLVGTIVAILSVAAGCAADRPAIAEEALAADATSAADSSTPLEAEQPTPAPSAPPKNPLDAARAYGYLQQICALGPRRSGSDGMKKQQALLEQHFATLGGKVSFQRFAARNPLGGDKVPMANLIVEWHPERKKRILLCAHYDTRPLPDQDPDPRLRREGVFLGANDGASGTAVLMELAHLMPTLTGDVGVDFVLFDGEELVYDDPRDPYFVGSTWFARQYAEHPPAHKYRWGVLLDMVGDANLKLYWEKNSATWRDTRPLVKEIWATAQMLGVGEFVPRVGFHFPIRDDHLPLRNIAKIPTCDIIDFDYPYWHTVGDTPQRCSGTSLAKVGWVVYEWLKVQ
jgi:hypothetical protein